MAMQCHFGASKLTLISNKTEPSGDRKRREVITVTDRTDRSPSDPLGPLLASAYQRRFFVGIGTASLVALGANFLGITSSLLGISPEFGRGLKLDLLYSIRGYNRCVDNNEGFEFIYPASWVGDQTLLYRAIGKAELERPLDPPPINDENNRRRRRNVSDPVVAFGRPGSSGELNVSVIVSPVSPDFSIEAFGGPKEIGEAVVKAITGSGKRPNVKGTLIESTIREDSRNVKYYKLEYKVESPSFRRHNVAVCCTSRGRLFTVNAQAPESSWPEVRSEFYSIADSFIISS